MGLSDALKKVAAKQVKKFGGEVVIQTVTRVDYNIDDGDVVENIRSQTVKGVIENVTSFDPNGLIRSDDKQLTVAAASLKYEPVLTDHVLIGDETHEIKSIKTVEQGNNAIIYQLLLKS